MKMKLEKLKIKKITGLFLAALAVTIFASCSSDDDANREMARVSVRMTDAPGDYQSVLVEVTDVMIKKGTGSEEEGWTSLGNIQSGVYDLLELTGGVTQLLADSELPAGYYSQIRLVLGSDNEVITSDGERQPLSTPSAQQSGLKLQLNQELRAGEDYEFLLDFDVDQSIVTAGSAGGYVLRPVIRLSTNADTGVISGEIHPTAVQGNSFQTVVRATNGTHNISSYTDANGHFVLNGVPQGTYKVTITPAATSGFQAKVINNVEVSSGTTIDLETIYLN